MRQMASSWPRTAISQQAVGQLPWGHLTVLLDKLTTQPDRDWYATAAAEHSWSRNVLLHHIKSQLHRRVGAAPSNFTDQLPAPDSDLAQQRQHLTSQATIVSALMGLEPWPRKSAA